MTKTLTVRELITKLSERPPAARVLLWPGETSDGWKACQCDARDWRRCSCPVRIVGSSLMVDRVR
jgi:hypothetical protein